MFGSAQLDSAHQKASIFSGLSSAMGIDTADARDATFQKMYEAGDRIASNYTYTLPSTSSFHPTEKDSGVDSTAATPPTRAEYRAAVNQSYLPGAPTHTNIGPFTFFDYTPTLKFYIDRHTPVRYLVSVRGTKFGNDYGYDDLKADKDIARGQLEHSARYQQDVQDMRFVLGDRPQGSRVYVTGHSLGGAICDLFLKQGLADGAVTYNPAMQLNAQEPRNHRVYNEHDPLYLLGMPHFNTPPEVKRDDVTATGANNIARAFGPYATYDELRAHDLASLSGSGKLSGTGFFDGVFNAGTQAYNAVTNEFTNPDSVTMNTLKSGSEYVDQKKKDFEQSTGIDTNLANFTEKLVDSYGFNSLDARAQEFLRQHGAEQVTSITIRRAPVASTVHALLNSITVGTWGATRGKYGYDDIFHLAMIVNGKYAIQRLGRVSLAMKDADLPGAEFLPITVQHTITIADLVMKTLERIGKDKFFKYDSFYNNCQHFLMFILETFGFASEKARDFILQPTEDLLKEQPGWTQTVANTLTNLGAISGIGSGKPTMTGKGMGLGYGGNVQVPRGARSRGNFILAAETLGGYMGLGQKQNQPSTTPSPALPVIDPNTPLAVANTPEEYARRMQQERDDYERWLAAAGGSTAGMFGKGKKTAEMYKAFTEDDIRSFCGNIPIMRYPELANMTDPSQLFQGKGAAALLFLTDGPSEGHWIAVLDRPDHYEVFDSFGTAIDGHRQWLDKKRLLEFDQTAPLLSNLLKGKGKPVIHNSKKLQSDTADTCGRFVAARIVQAATPMKQFVAELTSNGQTPDENIIEMTEPRDRAYPELANPAQQEARRKGLF